MELRVEFGAPQMQYRRIDDAYEATFQIGDKKLAFLEVLLSSTIQRRWLEEIDPGYHFLLIAEVENMLTGR